MSKKEISDYFKKMGKKGGKARAKKHKDKLSEWGKLGGRPPKKLDSQVIPMPNIDSPLQS